MPVKAFQDKHGVGRFWARLATAPDFYATLPLMPDAMELFEAVRHLDPVILTGPENQGTATRSAVDVDVKLYPPFGLLGQDRVSGLHDDAHLRIRLRARVRSRNRF